MTYKAFDVKQGSFTIDWDTCVAIIRSHHRARLQLKYSKQVSESQRGINPLSWGLPDLVYVEVNWAQVNEELPAAVNGAAHRLAIIANFDATGVDKLVTELQGMQFCTRADNISFQAAMRLASEKSMKDMEKSIQTYQTGVDRAKLVRDLSGSTLMGAATVVTGGGAGLAVAGAGAALKTVAKYQDSGSWGSAAIEASQQIVCTVIPVARGVKMDLAVKIIISTTADGAKALVEGNGVLTSIGVGGVNTLTGNLGDAGKKALTKVFGSVAAPIIVKVIEDQAKKYLQGQIKKLGADGDATGGRPPAKTKYLDISLHDDLLLKLAVIDMTKGVGRSWW